MDLSIDAAASAMLTAEPSADALAAQYQEGGRTKEVALATMALDPSLARLELLLASISQPDTGNEQYQALFFEQQIFWRTRLNDEEKAKLKTAIESAIEPGKQAAPGTSRNALARVVRARL